MTLNDTKRHDFYLVRDGDVISGLEAVKAVGLDMFTAIKKIAQQDNVRFVDVHFEGTDGRVTYSAHFPGTDK